VVDDKGNDFFSPQQLSPTFTTIQMRPGA
jgi:hypothetical protein